MSSAVAEPKKVERKKVQRKKPFESQDVKIEQHPPIIHPPLGEKMENEMNVEVVDRISEDELESMAFLEEPVKIYIYRHTDPAYSDILSTDYIANQGVPAQVLFKNGWVPMGYLPRGQAVYVKRKTVAQIAGAKVDTFKTQVEEPVNQDPINRTIPITTASFSFQVVEDRNPKGAAWLERILSRRA